MSGMALALLAFAGVTERAAACSCAGPPERLLPEMDAALTARLLDVRQREGPASSALFVYRVRRVFKGRDAYDLHRGKRLRIRAYLGGASCGLPRRERRRYGLLLYEKRGDLRANLCTVTSPRELRRAARRQGAARMGGTCTSAT